MPKSRKEQIEEMLADDPNDTFLRYGLAMEHVSAGDDAAALHCLQELLQVAPDYVPAYCRPASFVPAPAATMRPRRCFAPASTSPAGTATSTPRARWKAS